MEARTHRVIGEEARTERAGVRAAVRSATWLPIAGVLVLACFVRFNMLGYQSLTDDEGYSLGLSQRSFTDMLSLFRWEGNGTLYSVILWPLARVSDSVDVLRLPAVLAGVGAVAATYWAGRELANRRVALIGAFLLAVSPMAVRYAQFARPFSFVLLFAALSMALLARHLRTGGNGWLAGYSAVLALSAYSNTLAPVLLIPVHAALVAPAGRAALRRLAMALAGAAVLASPVIALALVETGRRDPLYWLTRPGLHRLGTTAQEFMMGGASSEVRAVRVGAVLALLAACLLLAAYVRSGPWRERVRSPLFVWTFLPIVLALAISLVRPVFFGAYLIVVLPGLCLLLAAGATRLPRRWSAGALIVLVAAWGTGIVAMTRPPRGENFRDATAFVVSQRTAADPVVIDPITELPAFGYYAPSFRAPDGRIVVKEWGDEQLPQGVVGFTDPGGYGKAPPGPPSAAFIRQAAGRTGRVVLVYGSTFRQGDVAEGPAGRWLAGHCSIREREFGGILVIAARDCKS